MTNHHEKEPSDDARRQRRKHRRLEWAEETKLAGLLAKRLDPSCTFWTAHENRPHSILTALLQRRRGVKGGLPDVQVIFRQRPTFVEMKSRSGRASKAQLAVRSEIVSAGGQWFMARSARAALVALHRAGVEFLDGWTPPADLAAWEGPFDGTEKRLPQHPETAARNREVNRRWRQKRRAQGLEVWRPRQLATEELRARQREATRRWRERKRARALEATAAERDDGAGVGPANERARPDEMAPVPLSAI